MRYDLRFSVQRYNNFCTYANKFALLRPLNRKKVPKPHRKKIFLFGKPVADEAVADLTAYQVEYTPNCHTKK